MFTKQFDTFVCEGDSISCEVDGLTITATVERDNDSGRPDKEMDGFWPSLNPSDAGYIGKKSRSTLARHMKQAKEVMQAWLDDEWYWCGIVLSVSKGGWQFDHAASLWGIDCNYPVKGKRRANAYLRDVANELLQEALEYAEEGLK